MGTRIFTAVLCNNKNGNDEQSISKGTNKQVYSTGNYRAFKINEPDLQCTNMGKSKK